MGGYDLQVPTRRRNSVGPIFEENAERNVDARQRVVSRNLLSSKSGDTVLKVMK